MLHGGEVELDCGTTRCLSFFLEPLLFLAPFCKSPISAKLRGVTNAWNELSVDAMRATWLPVFNKFVINDENLGIKVSGQWEMSWESHEFRFFREDSFPAEVARFTSRAPS